MKPLDYKRAKKDTSSSPAGNQVKYYDPVKSEFVKMDSPGGHEGLVEVLCDALLNHMTLNGRIIPHVHYRALRLGGVSGCASTSFTSHNTVEVSCESVLSASSCRLSGTVDDVEILIRAVQPLLHGQDFMEWLGACFLIDNLILNEDRHLQNLSLLRDSRGGYHLAPLFDNGAAYQFYKMEQPAESFRHFEPRPFLQEQLALIPTLLRGSRVCLNYSGFKAEIPRLCSELGRSYASEDITLALRKMQSAVKNFVQYNTWGCTDEILHIV